MRLREAHPQAHIALVTAAKLADLWNSHPAFDEVITFTKADGTGRLSRRLREGNFQKALILPNSFRSALESWLAGIPERIGFGGNGRRMLLTKVVPRRHEDIPMHKRSTAEIEQLVHETPEKTRDRFPTSAHHLHNYLQLVAILGGSNSPTPPRISVLMSEIDAFRAKLGLSDLLPVVGLNPGAEYGPAKRWPVERFIAAAVQVERQQPCEWLVTGGPGDVVIAEQIVAGIRSVHPTARIHNLAGKTSLRELCVALATCVVVLTNDTGPMHLAAAVGSRVVVPFGSTAPEMTGPGAVGEDRHRLILGQAPCAPCFLRECPIDFRCMLSITPERVAAAVVESLDLALHRSV